MNLHNNFLTTAAQHCFAADAAGAALGLGAIFGGDSVPPAVPVQTPASGAAESRRWAATTAVPKPKQHIPYIVHTCMCQGERCIFQALFYSVCARREAIYSEYYSITYVPGEKPYIPSIILSRMY